MPPAGAGDALVQGTDEGMFDEGVKSGTKQKRLEFREGEKEDRPAKKARSVPSSPSVVAGKTAAVEMVNLQVKIKSAITQFQGAKDYNPSLVKTVEAYITALDNAVHVGGSESDKKTYGDTKRKSYINSLNRYKKKFGIAVTKLRQRWV